METTVKTDVAIIQELLAIYAARKEAIEQMARHTGDTGFQAMLQESAAQTDEAIRALMDELSLHGDAVLADVDRRNKYMDAWKKAAPDVATMDDAVLSATFTALEQALLHYYREVIADRTEAGGTLNELLVKQEDALKTKLG